MVKKKKNLYFKYIFLIIIIICQSTCSYPQGYWVICTRLGLLSNVSCSIPFSWFTRALFVCGSCICPRKLVHCCNSDGRDFTLSMWVGMWVLSEKKCTLLLLLFSINNQGYKITNGLLSSHLPFYRDNE